jgi:putative intracellular protease/amidase
MMLGICMIWRNVMAQSIEGRKVAILATHGFEQAELTEPQKALKNAGATVHVVSPEQGSILAATSTSTPPTKSPSTVP